VRPLLVVPAKQGAVDELPAKSKTSRLVAQRAVKVAWLEVARTSWIALPLRK
jgi:hypothetical protein